MEFSSSGIRQFNCYPCYSRTNSTEILLWRVISECISLWESLPLVSIVFVKRSANTLAHTIARASSSPADRQWSFEDLSPQIVDVLYHDIR